MRFLEGLCPTRKMRVAGSGALGERISSTDRDWAQKNPCTGVFLAFDLAAPQTPKPSSSEKRQMPSALLSSTAACRISRSLHGCAVGPSVPGCGPQLHAGAVALHRSLRAGRAARLNRALSSQQTWPRPALRRASTPIRGPRSPPKLAQGCAVFLAFLCLLPGGEQHHADLAERCEDTVSYVPGAPPAASKGPS